MNLTPVRQLFAAAAIAMVATGCGDDPLDPDITGLVDAVLHDAPESTAAFTGTASGDVQVSIRSVGGTWVDLGSPNGITVALQSATGSTVHGAQSAPAGSYDRVRVTLSGVMFSFDAGGTIESTQLPADASAEAGASAPLVLELSVPAFEVSSSAGTARVSLDLNVQNWIDLQSLDDGVIQDGRIQGQVSVDVTR